MNFVSLSSADIAFRLLETQLLRRFGTNLAFRIIKYGLVVNNVWG